MERYFCRRLFCTRYKYRRFWNCGALISRLVIGNFELLSPFLKFANPSKLTQVQFDFREPLGIVKLFIKLTLSVLNFFPVPVIEECAANDGRRRGNRHCLREIANIFQSRSMFSNNSFLILQDSVSMPTNAEFKTVSPRGNVLWVLEFVAYVSTKYSNRLFVVVMTWTWGDENSSNYK